MTSARGPAAGSGRRSWRSLVGRHGAGTIVACFLAAAALALLPASGCGDRAVGIDDCRDLEYARCEAAAKCGDISDVDACRRFYRDHCAHGLPLSSEPAGRDVDACRLAIVAAGQCAEREGATAAATSCGDPDLEPGTDPKIVSACDVVRFPERVPACAFLTAVEAGAGGAASSPTGGGGEAGGAPAGQAGSGAAASGAGGAAGAGG